MLFFTFFYVVLLCLLRLQTNPGYLQTVMHHFYLIYSFALAGLYFLALPFLLFVDRHRPGLKHILCVMLLSFAFLQSCLLYQLNQDLRVLWEPQRIFLMRIDHFVKDHKKEPDFSFEILESELIYKHMIYLDSGHSQMRSLIKMFFPNYVTDISPKYYLVYTKNEGVRSFRSKAAVEQDIRELIKKNGPWHRDIYIGGNKLNEKMFLLMPSLINQFLHND